METDRKFNPLWIGAAAFGVFTVLALTLYFVLRPDAPPALILPVPNGHDTFLQAAEELSPRREDYREMDLDALRARVERNAAALELVRKGLQQECRVPVEFSMSHDISRLARFKGLAQALAAEGRFAEMEGRYRDAAQSFFDVIRFGEECSRGGLLIDGLVGIAIRAIGTRHLQQLVPRLDAATSLELAEALESFDERCEPWGKIMDQEREWSRRSYPFYVTMLPNARKSVKQAGEKGAQRFQQQQLHLRALMLELAARAFELETGQPPMNAAELAPAYLRSVPKDPATGADLSLLFERAVAGDPP
jgi:hypothetical protein